MMIDDEYFKEINKMYEQDIFYVPEDLSKVEEILLWAHKNGLDTRVTMLDMKKGFARIRADMDFDSVLSHITNSSKGYFRIIIRKNMNLFGILSNEKEIKDMLEIGIRGIDVNDKEYFIFIYLDVERLDELKSKYKLRML